MTKLMESEFDPLSVYAFDRSEVINGIANSAIYSLLTKTRYLLEPELATVLKSLSLRSFSLGELAHVLVDVISPQGLWSSREVQEVSTDFIRYLVRERLIAPVHAAVPAEEMVTGLQQAALTNRRIQIIGLELTSYCNFTCPHCSPRSGPSADHHLLSHTVVKQVAEWATRHGVRELMLTGGEPFTRKDISNVLRTIDVTSIPSVITTNGSVIRQQHVQLLAESASLRVRVSLYGSAEYYNRWGSGAATLQRIYRTIFLLQDRLGQRLSCVLPVMASNLDSLEERITFCKKNQIEYAVNVVCPFGRAMDNWSREAVPRHVSKQIQDTYDVYAESSNEGYRLRRKQAESRIHVFPCALDQINVLADKTLTPCLSIRDRRFGYYNPTIGANHLVQVFHSTVYREYLSQFAVNSRRVCKDCEFKYDCGGGCPAKALSYFGTLDAPDPDCEQHNIPSVFSTSSRITQQGFCKEGG